MRTDWPWINNNLPNERRCLNDLLVAKAIETKSKPNIKTEKQRKKKNQNEAEWRFNNNEQNKITKQIFKI